MQLGVLEGAALAKGAAAAAAPCEPVAAAPSAAVKKIKINILYMWNGPPREGSFATHAATLAKILGVDVEVACFDLVTGADLCYDQAWRSIAKVGKQLNYAVMSHLLSHRAVLSKRLTAIGSDKADVGPTEEELDAGREIMGGRIGDQAAWSSAH